MTKHSSPGELREYLVAVVAWSTHHAWIKADSEEDAEDLAQHVWVQDDSAFSYKDGGIDAVTVLESRTVQP
jgi:hypothetical protein